MTAAATGDTRHELYERPDLTRVKPAHVQLMRAYVSALAGASRVDRGTEPSKDPHVSGALVRWLVGSHIRRNLMILGTVYLQLEQTFARDDSDPIDPWLLKVREGCLAAAERLPRLRLPGIIGIVSAGAALSGLLSKLPGWVGALFLGIAIGSVTFLLAAYVTIRSSYLYKRSLFLRDAWRVDKEKTEDQKAVRDNNIYALEDELFRLLHRGKKRETEIDYLLRQISVSSICYGAALGLTIWRGGGSFSPGIPFYVALYVVAAIGILAILLEFRWRVKRAWR